MAVKAGGMQLQKTNDVDSVLQTQRIICACNDFHQHQALRGDNRQSDPLPEYRIFRCTLQQKPSSLMARQQQVDPLCNFGDFGHRVPDVAYKSEVITAD